MLKKLMDTILLKNLRLFNYKSSPIARLVRVVYC